MKRIFAFVCLCAFTVVAFGQNDVAERVSVIRKTYAQALENIKHGQEDANLNNSASVILNENWPGSGPCRFQADFYFTTEFDEEAVFNKRTIYMIRTKDLWADRPYTAEYLLDPKTEDLMFCFIRSPKVEGEGYDEIRYYFAEDGKLIRQISDGVTVDNPEIDFYLFDVRHCAELKNMFMHMPPYLDH